MDYNYSNNHEDNFQDESAEVIGYCEICDCEIKATDKYYHFYDYDMICPKCAKLGSVAKCEKCNTYFKIGDLTKYEYNSEIHYFCNVDKPEDKVTANHSDKTISSEQI